MVSPIKTDFPIDIAGKTYTLTFPMPAIWAFEDAANVEIFEDSTSTVQTPEEAVAEFDARVFGKSKRERMKRTALLLWAGLTTYHPEVTQEQASAFIYPRNMLAIRDKVLEAFTAALPGAKAQEEETENPPVPSPAVV